MEQESLIYSFVARGTVILAEYTKFEGNFRTIASDLLQKLDACNNSFTYNLDNYTFNYLVEDGYVYCVVSKKDLGREIGMAFLQRVKEDFVNTYASGKAQVAKAHSLNKEYEKELKEHMQYCVDHKEEMSKIESIRAKVEQTKEIMMNNIDKEIDRHQNIHVLVEKTKVLRCDALAYKNTGSRLKRKMWIQSLKLKMVLVGIVAVVILIVFLIVCPRFKCLSELKAASSKERN